MKKNLKTILSYLGAFMLALLLAVLLRLFVVDFFRIPSDSMLPTLEPGDFIVVNKLYYGPRFYKDFDFLKDGSPPRTIRIPGYAELKNNDVVVFNYPASLHWEPLVMDVSTFYVKRCIALPGDTVAISGGFYTVNGQRGFGDTIAQRKLACYEGRFAYNVFLTFPFTEELNWSIRDFGPWHIPRKGETLLLHKDNFPLYHMMITHESGLPLRLEEGQVFMKDSVITEYTFRDSWYFLGGDHVMNSRDSRYIGLIPEDFIVGKASFILTSRHPETGKYAWKRFFKRIK